MWSPAEWISSRRCCLWDPAIRAEEEKAKLLLANSIDDCQQLSWRRCAAAGSDRVCGSEPMTTAGPRGRAQRR
eukprot:7379946-Prymnesium_polylepis.2